MKNLYDAKNVQPAQSYVFILRSDYDVLRYLTNSGQLSLLGQLLSVDAEDLTRVPERSRSEDSTLVKEVSPLQRPRDCETWDLQGGLDYGHQ
jgi:hypothetical protein